MMYEGKYVSFNMHAIITFWAEELANSLHLSQFWGFLFQFIVS